MSISATNAANLSGLRFVSLQGTKQHEQVEAVTPETIGGSYYAETERKAPDNVDPVIEQKLSRLRDVQYAFTSALKIANYLESNYFFDPII